MEEKLSQIEKKLAEIEIKMDRVLASSEKMRKYFLWTLVVTIAVIVIPLLFLPFAISSLLQNLNTALNFAYCERCLFSARITLFL